MIKKLSVKNFKSIKEMEIDCRKINLFIGEPNSGKSNILETLALLSWCGRWDKDVSLKDYIRLQSTSNLFYDNSPDEHVIVEIEENGSKMGMEVRYENDSFLLYSMPRTRGRIKLFSIDTEFQKTLDDGNISQELLQEFEENGILLSDRANVLVKEIGNRWLITDDQHMYPVRKWENLERLDVSEMGEVFRRLDHSVCAKGGNLLTDFAFLKSYRFRSQDTFPRAGVWLQPPYGSNMFSLVMGSKKLWASMARAFKDFGFELVLRQHEKAFEFQKRVEDTENKDVDFISSYPYILASDTLQRMIFYDIAMESNENSTLIFEEPEAHAFPSDTHRFGKKIAFDKTNQYFITTHDPYLFLAILEKAPKEDVSVFITYVRDYQTKVRCLDDEETSKIMVYDPFANLDKFIGRLDSFVAEGQK